MPQHTPGPIEYTEGFGKRTSHLLIGHGNPPFQMAELNGPNKAVNGEHLADCWNACEGINPEAVPDLLKALICAAADLERAEITLRGLKCTAQPNAIRDRQPVILAAIAKAKP